MGASLLLCAYCLTEKEQRRRGYEQRRWWQRAAPQRRVVWRRHEKIGRNAARRTCWSGSSDTATLTLLAPRPFWGS